MVPKFNSKTHLYKRFFLFFWSASSAFVKSATMIKKLMREKLSSKKGQKNVFFTFITECKIFRPITLGELFVPFSTDSKSALNLEYFTYFINVESHFTSLSGLGGSILSKKSQNRCTLLYTCYTEQNASPNKKLHLNWAFRIERNQELSVIELKLVFLLFFKTRQERLFFLFYIRKENLQLWKTLVISYI